MRPQPTASYAGTSRTARANLGRRALVWFAFLALAFGLYTSLRYHFATWGLDPDSLQAGVIWMGMRASGLSFFPTFAFGPDNWLFSVIVPSIPLLDVLGPLPLAIVGLGWLAFVGTVAMAAMIARILSGPTTALCVAACIAMSNAQAIGGYAFMSHPASHDITFCWGLLAFLLLHRWLTRRSLGALGGAAVVIAADCISDPWAVVGVALPSLAGTLASMVNPEVRWRSTITAATILFALWVAETKMFGALSFLASDDATLADWATINLNFVALARSLGVALNPVPGVTQPFAMTIVLACVCASAAIAWASLVLVRAVRNDGPRLWVATTVITSAILPCCAFTVTDLPRSLMVARFAVPVVVFLPTISASALAITFRTAPPVARFGIPTLLTAIAFSGALGGYRVWFSPWRGMATDGVVSLTRFLREHDLTYGYGEYWGARANSVTVVSRGEVTVRPVQFDPKNGHISRRGDSALWYGPTSLRKGDRRFFVAFDDDGENCRSLTVCERGVQDQYGPANARYTFRSLIILAWNKPIVVP